MRNSDDIIIRPGNSDTGLASSIHDRVRIGAGGGSYGPGGLSSPRRRRLRLAARAQQQAEARDRAQREQEAATQTQAVEMQKQATAVHQQMIAEQTQQFQGAKTAIDDYYGIRSKNLEQQLQGEALAAKRAPDSRNSSDSWQVYLLKKEIAEIDGLIAKKTTELQSSNNEASSFYGDDPLTHSTEDYVNKINGLQTTDPTIIANTKQSWETAYKAAQSALELTESVRLLTEKTHVLAAQIPVKEALARAADERQQLHQIAVDKNQEHLRFKTKANEIVRLGQVSAAHTINVPVGPGLGAAVMTRTGLIAAEGAAIAIDAAIRAAVMSIVRPLVVSPVGATVAVFATTALYSAPMANGELTSEQRKRLFQGIAASPEALGLPEGTDLNSIADAGGEVPLGNRLSIEDVAEGTKINVVATGGTITPGVKVIHATANPQTNGYTAKLGGPLGQTLNFTLENNPVATGEDDWPIDSPDLALQSNPYAEDMPSGADSRIVDCIVCIPGLSPRYFSFPPPPLTSGIVQGTGQPATDKWWDEAGTTGAKIPSSVADRSRAKAFPTLRAFETDFWRELSAEVSLNKALSEANSNRLNKGYAPIAPRNQWLEGRKTYQLNDSKPSAQRQGALNLDDFSVGTPGKQGISPDSPPTIPWSVPDSPGMRGLMGTLAQQREAALSWFEQAIKAESQPGTRTETPRTPPGSEAIGSTTLPISPALPTIYPGDVSDPVQTQTDPLPGLDPTDVNANIPGYPSDEELPSPDVMEARNTPGTASGYGTPSNGAWLGENTRGEGAPIPSQIADSLRGQRFENFDRMREAIWKAVANDPELSKQFKKSNIEEMKAGRSPSALADDHAGKRMKFEIHHKHWIVNGGEVYGMDNLVILGPRQHIEIHKGNQS